MTKKSKKRLRILLIDGNNYTHRGFWAVQPLTNSEGFPTNAIKGMLNILLADISVLKPDRVVVTFDKGGKEGWRSEIYPEYKKSEARVKAKETDKAKDVFVQFKPIRQIIKAMGLKIVCKAGEEADDYMGTLATEFEEMGHEVLVSTNDKDMASLVTKNVFIVTAKTRELLDPTGIQVAYGVKPKNMIEFLMLLGDRVDNIPGVEKCGGKTAAKWLKQYGSIKNLLDNIEDFRPAPPKKKGAEQKPFPNVIQNLLKAKKHFKLTRKLITLKLDVKHSVTLDNCGFNEPDFNKLKRLCVKYELKETHRQILKLLKSKPNKGIW